MASRKGSKRPSLLERFAILGDAVAVADPAALRSAMYEVEDRPVNAERLLKLWSKTGKAIDDDLRQLWLHEMRQVQRVMSYAGAKEVIVDVLEFVEDDEHFGIVMNRIGRPLDAILPRTSSHHWLKNLGAPRSRRLFWANMRRIVVALGIIHAQGLLHGQLDANAILTEALDEPDFKLSGFEWSLWLSSDQPKEGYAKVGPGATVRRALTYSFGQDWCALGLMMAALLNVTVKASGDVVPTKDADAVQLSVSERVLLRRLVMPSTIETLEAQSIARSIDDIITSIARSVSSRAGSFILMLWDKPGLADAIYEASSGSIAVDDYQQQLAWIRADLDGGATLLVPRQFDPQNSRLRLASETLVYSIRAFRDDAGNSNWDFAVCDGATVRGGPLGEFDEHALQQPIVVVRGDREARELRARLGPDVLDWSAFAPNRSGELDRVTMVCRALILTQLLEAMIKALEVYPIEVLSFETKDRRRYVTVRGQPNSERDRVAARIGMKETADALRYMFEEDQRGSDGKWRVSKSASLGASRSNDVVATFVDVLDQDGTTVYQFEVEEDVSIEVGQFLKAELDLGTEQVIRRRLRNIAALHTRVDLAEMLDDPWRQRRSTRDQLDEGDQEFRELDLPKQEALRGLWSTMPSYFIVGPPGVGKTRLATEVLRRKFEGDPSTRILLTAQGHDALDNLQIQVKDAFRRSGLEDAIVVRSSTADNRASTDEEVHRAANRYLKQISSSKLMASAPPPLRDRVISLKNAASSLENAPDQIDREDRTGLHAFFALILDAANVVLSTVNSADVERLVDAREQFDWVIVEEAAKATGPELVGPMMLSGRRLLIGDHHQLPPFESERLVKLLRDYAGVEKTLAAAEVFVGPLLREGDLDELVRELLENASVLKATSDLALRLLEPFRTFVEDDERKGARQSWAPPNKRDAF